MIGPSDRPTIACLLANGRQIAELATGCVQRVVRCRAAGSRVPRQHLGMETQLVRQLGIEMVAAKPVTEAGKQFAHGSCHNDLSSRAKLGMTVDREYGGLMG